MRNLKKVLALLLALTMVLGTVVFADETVVEETAEVVEETAVEETAEEAVEEIAEEATEETTEEVVEETVETVVADDSFTDVEEGSVWEEPINLGVALGLFTGYGDGTFVPEGDITRAEFAAIVIRALGLEAQANGAKAATMFTDVASSHWASGYINLAVGRGIINGYGDGTFGPEDNVTYEQAVKMAVLTLGYKEDQIEGGYPAGYLAKGQETGLTENVNGSFGTPINRGQVAIIIYNALDKALMQQTGYGTFVEYKLQDGIMTDYKLTLLSEKFSVVKLDAVVNKAYDAESTKKTNVVEITALNAYDTKFDDTWYDGATDDIYVGDTDLKSYAGSRVIIYAVYDDVEDETTAIYVTSNVSSLDELKIYTNQVVEGQSFPIKGSGDDAVVTVEYREENNSKKTQKITVDTQANIFINGYAAGDDVSVAEAVSGKYGEITFALIDSKTTEADYDAVFVTDWDVLIVDSINTSSGRVIGKEGSTINRIVYNPDDDGYISTLKDANGKDVEWTSLEENDVINVKYYNGTIQVYECVLSDAVVEGEVDEVTPDGNDTEYTIAGTAYKLNPKSYDAAHEDLEDIFEVEDAGTFYLDILGRICYEDLTSAASGNYAYVVDFGKLSGLGAKGEIMLYTYQGELVTLKTASNVKYYAWDEEEEDVVAITDEVDEIVGNPADSDPETEGIQPTPSYLTAGDIITYQLNSAGEIYRITAPTEFDEVDADNTNLYIGSDGFKSAQYKESSSTLKVTVGEAVKNVNITDTTIIMAVDEDCRDDENYYALSSLAALVEDYDNWEVKVLDVNEDREAACVVVTYDSFDLDAASTPFAIVKQESTQKNAAGNTSKAYKVFQGGEEKTLIVADGETVDLEVGTVIIPKLTTAGELKATTQVVGQMDNGEWIPDDEYEAPEDVEYFAGNISDISATKIFYNDDEDAVKTAGANLYLYDTWQKSSLQMEIVDDFGDVYAEDNKAYDEEEEEWVDGEDNVNEIYNVNDEIADRAVVIYREFEGKVVDVIVYLYYGPIAD